MAVMAVSVYIRVRRGMAAALAHNLEVDYA